MNKIALPLKPAQESPLLQEKAGALSTPAIPSPVRHPQLAVSRLPYAPDPVRLAQMGTGEIRKCFLLEHLFEPERIVVYLSDMDRASIGGVLPGSSPLHLLAPPEFRSDFFAQRRELGIFNVGGPGIVRADDKFFGLGSRDALYLGRGSRNIAFESEDSSTPAMFYFVSYPAHASFEAKQVRADQAEVETLGEAASANRRTIRRYLRPPEVETCQLTMGLTDLEAGSIWNTMPMHRHPRRTEIYLYFNLPAEGAVFHLLGEPQETRHVVVRNLQAVLSPGWSVHCGVGTAHYSFIWSMGGENREFSDMDGIPTESLA